MATFRGWPPAALDFFRGLGADAASIVARLEKAGWRLMDDGALETAPRGYPADHPRIHLLRLEGLVVLRSWEAGPWLHTGRAGTRVRDAWRAARPLTSWIGEHVGA